MYEFIDTIEQPSMALPAEALSINGEYIENQIPGYRTLNVSGRELLAAEVTTEEVGRRDGTVYRRRRYPERTITVAYQLFAESNEEFRRSFEKLNDILNVEQAQMIFADDPEHYFIGTPNEASEIDPGRNIVTGSFNIVCPDPFKRSVELIEVEADSNGTFEIDYQGNFPSFPILEADFYQAAGGGSSGACGFVSFANARAAVLQFGQPDDSDDVIETSEVIHETTHVAYNDQQILTDAMNSVSGWAVNAGYTTKNGINLQVGTLISKLFSSTATNYAMAANSYGSGSGVWHGPSGTKTLGADSEGNTSHVNWLFSASLRFALSSTAATAKAQRGAFQMWVLDQNGKPIAGIQVWKGSNGTTDGKVRVYARVPGTDSAETLNEWTGVDLSHYNKRFGYKKNSTDSRQNGLSIQKDGNSISFKIGGDMTYTVTGNFSSYNAKKVCFFFGKYGSVDPVSNLGVYSCAFWAKDVEIVTTEKTVEQIRTIVTQQPKFGTNDVLIADCNDASICMKHAYDPEDTDGIPRPDLGALGNEWENFALLPGENYIGAFYSEWVQSAYKPSFKLRYREVFL